jgi:3-phenylpropionate/cinnamic acid dioxygenase small subunit
VKGFMDVQTKTPVLDERPVEPVSLRFTDPEYSEALEFLYREAELLNEDRLDEWQQLLAPDIVYRIPLRGCVEEELGRGFCDYNTWWDDDLMSLQLRVRHAKSTKGWSERPMSRTRRFVGNVRAWVVEGELHVQSSVLIARSRWHQRELEFLSGRRDDVLVPSSEGLKLRRREVLLDQTDINMPNLAIFI